MTKDILDELPVGPCPTCGSNEIVPHRIDGYGRMWICECGKQVPTPTLPPEILRRMPEICWWEAHP